MNLVLTMAGLLLLSGVSGVLFLSLLTRLDSSSLDKTPGTFLGRFVLAGLFSLIPAWGLYLCSALWFPYTPGSSGRLLFIWTVNAPVEEAAKFLCFAALALVSKSIREPQDGSLQGAALGLGFALGENLLYGLNDGLDVLVLRIFVSLPGHMIYGAVWGGCFGFEVFQGGGKVRNWGNILLALVPAVFSHALFNTLAELQVPFVLNLAGDGATLALGVFLFLKLRSSSPYAARWPFSRWKEALPVLDQGILLNPQAFSLRLWRGAYLIAADETAKAIDSLELAKKIRPQALWPDFYLSLAYWKNHDEKNSRLAWKRWKQKSANKQQLSADRLALALLGKSASLWKRLASTGE